MPNAARHARLCCLDDATAADRYRVIVDSTALGIGYGQHDRVVDANPALLDLLGMQPSDLANGIALRDIAGGDEGAERLLGGQQPLDCDATRLDGTPVQCSVAAIRLSDSDWLLVAVDLGERTATERIYRHLALHDPTTGMPNRRLLMDRLEQTIARAARENTATAVLFCDIDHFKSINDSLGHRAGDTALQLTATRLASVLRQTDTIARVGGDEFVVVLEGLADPTEATQLAERARVAVTVPMHIGDAELHITASIGVAIAFGRCNADDVLRRADDAMYRAKGAGRNQVAFTPEDVTPSH